MDFTLSTYKHLLDALQNGGYSFQTFTDFINDSLDRAVVMLHDVDKLPGNALKMAELEQEMGIRATYYFRAVDESFDLGIMKKIERMGHEIGYHYENVDSVNAGILGCWNAGIMQAKKRDKICPPQCHLKAESYPSETGENFTPVPSQSRTTGQAGQAGNGRNKERLIDLAYEDFCRNLEMFRENFDVKTICMHGSPLSRYDNRMVWEKYDYKKLGIITEPYFDVDYSQVFYITDTGRKWNNEGVSVRDRVEGLRN